MSTPHEIMARFREILSLPGPAAFQAAFELEKIEEIENTFQKEVLGQNTFQKEVLEPYVTSHLRALMGRYPAQGLCLPARQLFRQWERDFAGSREEVDAFLNMAEPSNDEAHWIPRDLPRKLILTAYIDAFSRVGSISEALLTGAGLWPEGWIAGLGAAASFLQEWLAIGEECWWQEAKEAVDPENYRVRVVNDGPPLQDASVYPSWRAPHFTGRGELFRTLAFSRADPAATWQAFWKDYIGLFDHPDPSHSLASTAAAEARWVMGHLAHLCERFAVEEIEG